MGTPERKRTPSGTRAPDGRDTAGRVGENSGRELLDSKITEKAFMALVIRYSQLRGWLCFHTYDSRRSQPGFPDLVLVGHERLIFAELKSEKGRLRKEQKAWLAELEKTDSTEVYVWRPSDFESVTQILTPHGRRAA
jgi:hypothetical protein